MKKLLVIATLLFATCASAQVREGATAREATARFGETIARALNERDDQAFASLIDLRSLAVRSSKVLELNAGDQESYVRGVETVGLQRMIAGYFQTMNASNGAAQFMRVTNTTPARALVRLDLGANGFDYLEYVVETREGRTRAVDWFQLSSGELISVTMGGIAQLFTSGDPGLVGRLFNVEKVDQTAVTKLRKIGELQRAGKYAEALAALQQLPPQFANARIMLSMQASMALLAKDDDAYSRVLAKLAEKYSDDPAAAFKLVDHYLLQKDLPNTLKAIDTMEKRVGVDGVTNYLRAAAYIVSDDFGSGLKYAEQSIKLEPDRMNGYDMRASALVGLGRFPEAVDQYRDIEKRFEVQLTRQIFEEDPKFAKFVASPAFKSWLPR